MQSPLGGDHFEHARRQLRGLAFAQRACSHCQVYNHVRPGLDTGSSRDHNYTFAFIVLCVISTFCIKSTDCPIYLQIYELYELLFAYHQKSVVGFEILLKKRIYVFFTNLGCMFDIENSVDLDYW